MFPSTSHCELVIKYTRWSKTITFFFAALNKQKRPSLSWTSHVNLGIVGERRGASTWKRSVRVCFSFGCTWFFIGILSHHHHQNFVPFPPFHSLGSHYHRLDTIACGHFSLLLLGAALCSLFVCFRLCIRWSQESVLQPPSPLLSPFPPLPSCDRDPRDAVLLHLTFPQKGVIKIKTNKKNKPTNQKRVTSLDCLGGNFPTTPSSQSCQAAWQANLILHFSPPY